VEDLCHAIYSILNPESLSLNPGFWDETLQIATGQETTINDLFARIKLLVERDLNQGVTLKYEGRRRGEIMRSYSDISKAKKFLNYEPKIKLDEGLRRTWDWFKTQNLCKGLIYVNVSENP